MKGLRKFGPLLVALFLVLLLIAVSYPDLSNVFFLASAIPIAIVGVVMQIATLIDKSAILFSPAIFAFVVWLVCEGLADYGDFYEILMIYVLFLPAAIILQVVALIAWMIEKLGRWILAGR